MVDLVLTYQIGALIRKNGISRMETSKFLLEFILDNRNCWCVGVLSYSFSSVSICHRNTLFSALARMI